MVATPLPNPYPAEKSTNVRTLEKRKVDRPKTVPETLADLLDWFVGFVGLGITPDDLRFSISREEIHCDLQEGRD